MNKINRFDVFLVNLDPTIGSEIQKTRPCAILSPDEMSPLQTVIVAPMTTKGFAFPTRIKTNFNKKSGFIILDQIRAIDKTRLTQKLGKLDSRTAKKVLNVLQEMFAQ